MPCKPCICCSKRPEINAVTITFRVLDNDGCPICGALFRLECDCECCMYIHAISNKNGCVSFCNVCPGTYNLEQLASGCGYEFDEDDALYEVTVSRSGNIRINDRVINCFTVYNTRCGDDPNVPT